MEWHSCGRNRAHLIHLNNPATCMTEIYDVFLCCFCQVIPGNDTQVAGMLNSLSLLGARVVQGRGENLHTSGHAYQVKRGE